MQHITETVIGKTNLVFAVAAEEESIPEMQKTAVSLLKDLPDNPVEQDVSYDIEPEQGHAIGVYVDAPSQASCKIYDSSANPDMLGRYMPFITAVSDKYIVPVMRFQEGAYSTAAEPNTRHNWIYAWTSDDPNAAKTVKVYQDLPNQIKTMELTEEELEGYIANTYGAQTGSQGPLLRAEIAMEDVVTGFDRKAWRERVSDIRNASLADQPKAAENLAKEESDSVTVVAGNRKKIEQDAKAFDLILDYQNPEKSK